jgi:hypothetical protein
MGNELTGFGRALRNVAKQQPGGRAPTGACQRWQKTIQCTPTGSIRNVTATVKARQIADVMVIDSQVNVLLRSPRQVKRQPANLDKCELIYGRTYLFASPHYYWARVGQNLCSFPASGVPLQRDDDAGRRPLRCAMLRVVRALTCSSSPNIRDIK